MEEYESYGLEHIQSVLLTALVTFDKLCRENKILYSLHGGTLLGAERNHRFIPWDDDIDVSMKREEYCRLRTVVDTLPDNFILDEISTRIPRLIMRKDNETVYLDILIWDYISSHYLEQRFKIVILHFIQGMCKRNISYKKYNMIGKSLVFITSTIGRMVPYERILKQYAYVSENCFIGDKKCIHRSNDSFAAVSQVYDANYMNEYSNIEFEEGFFMVNRRYRENLMRSYGNNYLLLPPKEKRKPQHEHIRENIRD